MKPLAKLFGKLDRDIESLDNLVWYWEFLLDGAQAAVLDAQTQELDDLQAYFTDERAEAFALGLNYFELWDDGNFMGEYADPERALATVRNLARTGLGPDLVLVEEDCFGHSTRVAAGAALLRLAENWPEERAALIRQGKAALDAIRDRIKADPERNRQVELQMARQLEGQAQVPLKD